MKPHFLRQGVHFFRGFRPVLLMVRRDGQFPIEFLKLRVQIDSQRNNKINPALSAYPVTCQWDKVPVEHLTALSIPYPKFPEFCRSF